MQRPTRQLAWAMQPAHNEKRRRRPKRKKISGRVDLLRPAPLPLAADSKSKVLSPAVPYQYLLLLPEKSRRVVFNEINLSSVG